eukprot:749115-Hanusia_phi.AAC.1
MDACAVALGGALPLHHIRSCPSLLQPIQDELDKVTCGDLGVDASDSDVSASMVEVYRGRSFGVTVLSLPAGASLPMQDLQVKEASGMMGRDAAGAGAGLDRFVIVIVIVVVDDDDDN